RLRGRCAAAAILVLAAVGDVVLRARIEQCGGMVDRRGGKTGVRGKRTPRIGGAGRPLFVGVSAGSAFVGPRSVRLLWGGAARRQAVVASNKSSIGRVHAPSSSP